MQPQKQPSTLYDSWKILSTRKFSDLLEDKELLKDMLRLYRYMYDPSACAGCSSQYSAMFEKVINGEKLLLMKSNRNFEMKQGVSLQLEFGSRIIVNNHTLTDDLAIEHLTKNPNAIVHYAVFPENWQDIVAGKAKLVKKEASPEEPEAPGIDLNKHEPGNAPAALFKTKGNVSKKRK